VDTVKDADDSPDLLRARHNNKVDRSRHVGALSGHIADNADKAVLLEVQAGHSDWKADVHSTASAHGERLSSLVEEHGAVAFKEADSLGTEGPGTRKSLATFREAEDVEDFRDLLHGSKTCRRLDTAGEVLDVVVVLVDEDSCEMSACHLDKYNS